MKGIKSFSGIHIMFNMVLEFKIKWLEDKAMLPHYSIFVIEMNISPRSNGPYVWTML